MLPQATWQRSMAILHPKKYRASFRLLLQGSNVLSVELLLSSIRHNTDTSMDVHGCPSRASTPGCMGFLVFRGFQRLQLLGASCTLPTPSLLQWEVSRSLDLTLSTPRAFPSASFGWAEPQHGRECLSPLYSHGCAPPYPYSLKCCAAAGSWSTECRKAYNRCSRSSVPFLSSQCDFVSAILHLFSGVADKS